MFKSTLNRQALQTFTEQFGSSQVEDLLVARDDAFKTLHGSDTKEAAAMTLVADDLDQSFSQTLKDLFTDFDKAQQIAQSRVE